MRRSVAVAGGGLAATGVAGAHVRYVTESGEEGDALAFLTAALSEPATVAVLGAGALAAAAATAGYYRYRPLAADFDAAGLALRSYRDLVPWMLRLAIGLPLVGAGYNGYLFVPTVVPEGGALAVRLFGIGVGFLLLFGLLTRLVAAVGLAGYLVGLAGHPDLWLAFEYLPAFVGIVLAGGGRPSADHVILRLADDDRTRYSTVDPFHRRLVEPFRTRVERYEPLLPTVVRVGLGLTFVFLGLVEKLLAPARALAVVEQYDLTAVVPVSPELWVLGAGVAEVAVGLALVAGVLTRGVAGVAFLLLVTTLFGLPDDPVLAHVSLFGLTSVLLVTGAGPYALDGWLARRLSGRDSTAGHPAR